MAVKSMTKFLTCRQNTFVAVSYQLVFRPQDASSLASESQYPRCISRLILVAINHPKTRESRSRLQHRQTVRVANQLGVVVIEEGGRYYVGPGREVYDSRSDGRRGARTWSATVSIADSFLYSCSIIRHTISAHSSVFSTSNVTV